MVGDHVENIAEKPTIEEFAGTFGEEKTNENDEIEIGLDVRNVVIMIIMMIMMIMMIRLK